MTRGVKISIILLLILTMPVLFVRAERLAPTGSRWRMRFIAAYRRIWECCWRRHARRKRWVQPREVSRCCFRGCGLPRRLRSQSQSLAAEGISFPGVPQVVGPFSVYDARAYADQSIVDMQLWHGLRSAKQSTAAAKEDYQDARDLVIRNVAALYLSAQSEFAEVVAAESRVDTAQALYKLAAEQRDAGVATGIDVLRAQVQLANERQSLVQSRNRAKSSLLVLARNIGMSPGTDLELADPLAFHPIRSINVESVLPQALARGPDYQSLRRQHDALMSSFAPRAHVFFHV